MGSGQWTIEKRAAIKSDSISKDLDTISEVGCLSIVVLGASGDLAKKKTFPALFNLYRQVRNSTGSACCSLKLCFLQQNSA